MSAQTLEPTGDLIPVDAPYSDLQRVWLAGYLAGLASAGGAATDETGDRPPLLIGYGSQTGNAEGLAAQLAQSARAAGFAVTVTGLDDLDVAVLAGLPQLLVITSTYGEGEMPDNAELFWGALRADDAPDLSGLGFGVLALGDTGYDGFCQAGKSIDTRLEQLGARRLVERVDCDVDFEDDAAAWVAAAVPAFAGAAGAVGDGSATGSAANPSGGATPGWSRKHPYLSRLSVNRLLSGRGSSKEIRHLELDLGDSGIDYQAGDALALLPGNDPALVAVLLDRLGVGADHVVGDQSLAELLGGRLEIRTPPKQLVSHVGEHASDPDVRHLLRHGEPETIKSWLWGKDVADLLTLAPLSPADLVALLRPLQFRSYSISSAPLAHPGRIHLTVAAVRHTHDGRLRGGVASTYLADRASGAQEEVPIFLQPNSSFRLPADDVPVVMIGPGTGIAPFRAFLHERHARGASGRNWLFFGDQHRSCDFIYADELAQLSESGTLTRLDLAFSRDQAEKVYVQTRMRENGAELFAWLQEGADLYVCGDASRMARDVEEALVEVVATHGGLAPEAAMAYVDDLKRTKRYARDVY